MAYHNKPSKIRTQGQIAPPGYHYMPDGTLMSNTAHAKLSGGEVVKIIHGFDVDLDDIAARGGYREFNINGDVDAGFKLEIKNSSGEYYNFTTRVFQTAVTRLSGKTDGGSYKARVLFPSSTSAEQYDVYLWADADVKHADHNEVRFGDGSVDINSSTGSNSLLLQKVIYQYPDLALTLSTLSPQGAVEVGSQVNNEFAVSRGKASRKTPFEISCSVATATKSYQIIKQPKQSDVIAFVQATIGSAPIKRPRENEYPTVNDVDFVDGATTTTPKIVIDSNVADKMVVGDKITIEDTDLTDTINSTVTSGQRIVMDSNVATKMAVGDRVLGLKNDPGTVWVSVTHLDPDGDNPKEFQIDLILGGGVQASDGATLTFVPKCNRQLFTVAALNPDGDNVKEFSYVADDGGGGTFGVRDNVRLSFSSRKNYSWPIDNYANIIKEGMIIAGGGEAMVAEYKDSIIEFEGTEDEKEIVISRIPALDTTGKKPTVVKGLVTVQAGDITFNIPQALDIAGDTLKIGGYGESAIFDLYGYRVKFSDLAIALTPITTTTTAASAGGSSTSVVVASRNGILDDISTVSGIGINPAVVNPTVASGAGAVSGAGTIVLSAAQALEDGITLTFTGAGQTATITGNIEVLEAGTADQALRFDVERLLSIT